jgi:hypothetical protein
VYDLGAVTQDLNLYVARAGDEPLEIQTTVAERGLRFGRRLCKLGLKPVAVIGDTNAGGGRSRGERRRSRFRLRQRPRPLRSDRIWPRAPVRPGA